MVDPALFSRRGMITAAPAAIAAVSIPTFTSVEPDAELLALREPYERTLAALDLAAKPHSAAEDAFLGTREAGNSGDERALRKASGPATAERAYNRAARANLAVIDEIGQHSARTLEGLRFKAEISSREGNMHLDLLESIVADLVALGRAGT